MKSLQANGLAEKTKKHFEKDPEHDDWQNEDDSGQDIKPESGELIGPKLWRMQRETRTPTAPLLNLLKRNLEAS